MGRVVMVQKCEITLVPACKLDRYGPVRRHHSLTMAWSPPRDTDRITRLPLSPRLRRLAYDRSNPTMS